MIGVEFCPINPSDLLLAMGIYGLRPALPTVIAMKVSAAFSRWSGGAERQVGDRVPACSLASPGGAMVHFPQWTFRPCLLMQTRATAMLPSIPTAALLLSGYVT